MTVRVLAAVPAKADSEVLYGRARRGGPPGPGTCRRNSVSARAARALAKSLESFNGTVPAGPVAPGGPTGLRVIQFWSSWPALVYAGPAKFIII